MLRASSDLTAKFLIEGKIVDVAIIYGLAATHTTKSAKLLQILMKIQQYRFVQLIQSKWVLL